MAGIGRRRSYAEAVAGRRLLARRAGVLILVFLSYEALSGIFIAASAAGSRSMEPTVEPGDRLLSTPLAFGPLTPLGKLPGIVKPRRGDLVVTEPTYAARIGGWKLIADAVVRFATLQRVSLAGEAREPALSGPVLKRVIALPGDSIKMENFVYMVKPAGQAHYLTEFELSRRRYDISRDNPPEGWLESMPGSGTMPERILAGDECYLAGDARSSSSDSRDWGPVPLDRLRSLVFLRYWPLRRFGIP